MKKLFKGLVTTTIVLAILGGVFLGGYYVKSHNLIDKYRIQRYVDTWNEEFGFHDNTRAEMRQGSDDEYYFVVKQFDEYGKLKSVFEYDMDDIEEMKKGRS